MLQDVAAGQLDAALVYTIPDEDYWFNPVALDGLVILKDGSNPIENLTIQQISDLFAGVITDWSSLGGPETAVQLYVREPGSGAAERFDYWVMAGRPIDPEAIIAADETTMRAEVGASGALGYGLMGIGQDTAFSVEGSPATPMTTADQSYPLTVPLYFVALVEPTGDVRQFLGWLQSSEGQEIIGQRYGRIR